MARFFICLLGIFIGYMMCESDMKNDIKEREDQLWEIRELAKEIRDENERGHMVISQMYDSIQYAPMSNQEEINRLSNEIMFICEKQLR